MVRCDKQANGLECDRLPSRVWPSDEEYALALTEFKVYGNHSAEQERIAYLEKKIQTKDEVLAELMAEHISLKKEIGEL